MKKAAHTHRASMANSLVSMADAFHNLKFAMVSTTVKIMPHQMKPTNVVRKTQPVQPITSNAKKPTFVLNLTGFAMVRKCTEILLKT